MLQVPCPTILYPRGPGHHGTRHIPGTGKSSLVVSSGGVIVVVVANNVVVVSKRVELVVLVLPPVPHGQLRGMTCPVARCRHTKASVAETGRSPEGAQMQSGEHVAKEIATFKMNRQSVETGVDPLLSGWEQSPCAARAVPGKQPSPSADKTRASPRVRCNAFTMVASLTGTSDREKEETKGPVSLATHGAFQRERFRSI
jgi:hypothetical protein